MMGPYLGALAFVIQTVGSTVPVVSIPSSIDKDAVFEAGESSGQSEEGALVASSKDGARIVVGEAALVTGTHGSKIHHIESLESGDVRLAFESGGFLIHVGSKPVILDLGGFEIEVSSARLAIMQKHGEWLLKVLKQYSNRKPQVRYTVVNQDIPLEGAVDPVEPRVFDLDSGKTFRMVPGEGPKVDLNGGEGLLGTLIQDLKEPVQSFTLEPHDVEDPSDIVATKTSAEGDMAEIEIEAVEIEIEADCVEICVD